MQPQRNAALSSDRPERSGYDERVSGLVPARGADELDTIAVALTAAAGAATDRIAAVVRTLRPAESVDEPTVTALQSDVRMLHAAVEHLRSMHVESDRVSRPAPEMLDAVAVAAELTEELQAEGLLVQVESTGEPLIFPGNAPDVRRILRWMIERASSADSAPWVRLQIVVDEGSVGFELPWYEDDAGATGSAEREWLVHLIHEQAGTLSTRGLRARVSFPLESAARDVMHDPDALAREIAALREQRTVHLHEQAAVSAQLRSSQIEVGFVRAYASRLEKMLHTAALDLQSTLEALGGTAAALAERDALGSEVQAGVQTALDRVVLLLQEANMQSHGTPTESHASPRVHTEEPDPIGSYDASGAQVAVSNRHDARTLPPPMIEDDPDEAEIPLARPT